MKEILFSAVKKLAVILIASVMLLGVVPVGLIAKPTTVSAEGEFLRLNPSAEAFVSAALKEQEKSGGQIAPGLQIVGGNHEAYFRFDLSGLLDKDIADIHEATLRLAMVRGGGMTPVRVKLMQNNDWNGNMTYKSRPAVLGEIQLAEISPVTGNAGESLVELDFTEYVKKWIEDGRTEISLHLDSAGSAIAAVFAGTGYEDRAYRPCLKVVTGDASDPDSDDLTKAWLESAVTLDGEDRGDVLTAGRKRETYLKFRLNPNNIQGAMYLVQLQLEMLNAEEDSELRIYQLKHTEGGGEEELLVYSTLKPEENRLRRIDLTDVVNDAYYHGETELNLRLVGTEAGAVTICGTGKQAPRLAIRATDDKRVQAAIEAAVHALGENSSQTAVRENLLNSYTAADGSRAALLWRVTDPETGVILRDAVSASGIVARPKWFEPARYVRATASISSGGYSRERSFYLTLLPEEAPNYDGEGLSALIHMGSSSSETHQKLETSGTAVRDRWIEGKRFGFRSMEPGDMMVLNLACDPEKQNYLTLKTWEGDSSAERLMVYSLQEKEAEPVEISDAEEGQEERKEGFLYQTYPLPLVYTRGRAYVSLALKYVPAEKEKPAEKLRQDIYGAYLTQTAYFDPLSFAEQGEEIAGKTPVTDTAFYKFLKRLYLVTQQPMAAEESASSLDKMSETAYTWVDQTTHTVLFRDGGDQIAVSIPEDGDVAEVHRNALYYDTYSRPEVQKYTGGLYAVSYGGYQIIQNKSEVSAHSLPWEEQRLSGVYQDLVNGVYYSFLREGEMADDSVIPEGAALLDGRQAVLESGATMVLTALAEPLYFSDWRVSGINGKSVSQVKITQELPLERVTVKNVGKEPEKEEILEVICAIYDRGILTGIEHKKIAVHPGQSEYIVPFSGEELTVFPGQTLKIFIESQAGGPQNMTAKFELP